MKNLMVCIGQKVQIKKYNKLDCFYDYANNLMKGLTSDFNVGFEYNIIEKWRDECVI